jgi:hypothetical protein
MKTNLKPGDVVVITNSFYSEYIALFICYHPSTKECIIEVIGFFENSILTRTRSTSLTKIGEL